MTLYEAENLVHDTIERDIDTGEPEWSRRERVVLARVLLAVLPVVRAAEAWTGTPPPFAGDADVKLHEAIHKMREALR